MINFAKAIAGNSDLLTAQAFVYQSLNLNLSFLITATGDDVFTKVRLASSSTESKFFEMEGSIPDRLTQTLEFLAGELKDLEDVEILLAAWQENILYIESIGQHQVFLLRERQLTNLTPTSELSKSQLISGHLKKGDMILFITKSIESFLSPAEKNPVIERLLKSHIDDFEGELNSIWRKEDSIDTEPPTLTHTKDPLAAILIDFYSDELEEKVEIPNLDEPRSAKPIFRKINFKKALASFLLIIPKGKRVRLILAATLLLVILAGIGWSVFNRGKESNNTRITTLINSASDKLAQAQNLKDLDPKGAKENLESAKKDLNDVLLLSPNDSKIKDLQKELDNKSPEILKIFKVEKWPIFLNLDLVKKDFAAKKLSESLGKALLLDVSKKTLVLIDLKNKSNQILAGENQMGKATFASLNGDFAFVYSDDKGVVKVDTKSQKAANVVKPDSEWGKIVDIYGFGGNIYLLDILKNQVWKYVPVANGYSGKTTYFKSGQSVNLANAKRIQIDSSVWLLLGSNEIKKFTSGAEDNFSLKGLDKNILSLNSFYVSDTTENIYLLDSGNSRLVVLNKIGEYLSQYQGDKFKSVSDLVVDEKDKKIYILENSKIYSIDLK